ncbi:acid phosphatase type 7 [Lycorma delicatula]|uniref:acid phosphatase type 7 n=1 Tax=Lycorma delicatula TaxID=130591 RepID=UPI003F51017A
MVKLTAYFSIIVFISYDYISCNVIDDEKFKTLADIDDLLTKTVGDMQSPYDIIYFYQPEQVHISYGENLSSIVVTWSTKQSTNSSIVEYGINGLVKSAFGYQKLFVDGGPLKRFEYIHRVVLENLQPNEIYLYHCGSDLGWSPEFWFKTARTDSDWSPHLAVYGDLGNINAQSLPRLQQETQRNMYDAILHVGDFAYDFDFKNGEVGDEFMKQLEPIAAYVPYMVVPGNHEEKYNFSHYKARFSMPGGTENIMYSFNLGPAHFIGFSTEVYYFINYGIKPLVFQYDWLENDLKEATKPENRKKHPWIITFGHRPMYCSNSDKDDCTYNSTLVRIGIPIFKWFGLEKLFYDYGVDLEIWAHEHSYERLWPVYNTVVYNGTLEEPYTNPRAPVHVVTGSAGCRENTDGFIPKPQPWSAFRSSDYGYARLKIHNATHIHIEQVSDDKGGQIIDSFWIKKNYHGPYNRPTEQTGGINP